MRLEKIGDTEVVSGNTSVKFFSGPSVKIVKVFLHDSEILSVLSINNVATSIRVSICSVIKENGKPSKTAIERLNGLLDELGYQSLLPEGVRIFWSRDDECYHLGRGDEKIALGQNFATNVLLRTDSTNFRIEGSNMEVNSMSYLK